MKRICALFIFLVAYAFRIAALARDEGGHYAQSSSTTVTLTFTKALEEYVHKIKTILVCDSSQIPAPPLSQSGKYSSSVRPFSSQISIASSSGILTSPSMDLSSSTKSKGLSCSSLKPLFSSSTRSSSSSIMTLSSFSSNLTSSSARSKLSSAVSSSKLSLSSSRSNSSSNLSSSSAVSSSEFSTSSNSTHPSLTAVSRSSTLSSSKVSASSLSPGKSSSTSSTNTSTISSSLSSVLLSSSKASSSSSSRVLSSSKRLSSISSTIKPSVYPFATSTPQFNASRLVFAAYAINSAYKNANDYLIDIQRAKSLGIDGFAIEVTSNELDFKPAERLYNNAAKVEGFYTYYTFNIDTFQCMIHVGYSLISVIIDILHSNTVFSNNTMNYNGKQVWSSFGGQDCTWGDSSPKYGWQNVTNHLPNLGYPTSWWGGFDFKANQIAEELQVLDTVDGFINYHSYPSGKTAMNDSLDFAWLSETHSNSNVFIDTVSPWYYSGQNNEYFRSEDLWHYRWNQLNNIQPEFLLLRSWNSYGESNYIQANLADGDTPKKNHTGWFGEVPYLIRSFKSGMFVRPSDSEIGITLTHRAYYKDANQTDTKAKSAGYENAIDAFMIHSILKEPMEITLTSTGGGYNVRMLPVGVALTQIDFADNMIGNITLTAEGCTITGSEFRGYKDDKLYDFNPYNLYCKPSSAFTTGGPNETTYSAVTSKSIS